MNDWAGNSFAKTRGQNFRCIQEEMCRWMSVAPIGSPPTPICQPPTRWDVTILAAPCLVHSAAHLRFARLSVTRRKRAETAAFGTGAKSLSRLVRGGTRNCARLRIRADAASHSPEARKVPHKRPQAPQTCGISAPDVVLSWIGHFCTRAAPRLRNGVSSPCPSRVRCSD
jgi:hypothetical protein